MRVFRAKIGGSFHHKVLFLVLTIILLMGLAMTVQTRVILAGSLSRQLDQRALTTAEAVAAQSTELILTGDLYALHQMLRDMQTSGEDIRYIFIQDNWGRVLSHTFVGGFPIDLLAYNPAVATKIENQKILATDEGLIHQATVPIMGGQLGVVRGGTAVYVDIPLPVAGRSGGDRNGTC
ncbi:Uncharacterized [Moorella glycerini]|uniref:Single cache domain-containing protein n=1 Tax=Neomoorella stamsii TaxID=1266720 RepID=A0A9X7P6H2_9FIRM|nr:MULTISPECIES: hypothetical protein [Moorella]PRR73508.1 hypothetical protein MOST_13560 [Moorella stamsii]CEP69277.1 Uncharacterized [Moorella glycerini]